MVSSLAPSYGFRLRVTGPDAIGLGDRNKISSPSAPWWRPHDDRIEGDELLGDLFDGFAKKDCSWRNSSGCFGSIKDRVGKKIRRPYDAGPGTVRASVGKRWSTQSLYESLRLYNGYKVRWLTSKVAPARQVS
jgi:hypothetical protein